MKIPMFLGLTFVIFPLACGQETNDRQADIHLETDTHRIHSPGRTLETRIRTPVGFERISADTHTFAHYLRQLPLKPHGSKVLLYNGETKTNDYVHDAVVDLDIGAKNLHQCADAVMRLRATYLWNRRQYDRIHFNFTNGFRVDYSEWMKGRRIAVRGNRTYWTQSGTPSNTYRDFWEYLEIIFTFAGTRSLAQELEPVSKHDMRIGDVFIQGGSPGHAVIVVDMAVNPITNAKIFLLAQSYMPAQETHIVKNPNNQALSPWYALDFGQKLMTPEWTFRNTDLKRFTE